MLLFSIITENSLWFAPLCFLVAAVYTWILYRKEQTYKDAPKIIRRALPVFRFISVSIITFLLLSPFFQSSEKTIEKPIIIIAQDNSESIIYNKDSSFYKSIFPQKIRDLEQSLSNQFTVKTLMFDSRCSDTVNLTYKGKNTHFDALFSHIAASYSNYNVGAIIVASDGIYNRGSSPAFAADASEIKAPIYTIAMGDTVGHRDLAILGVKHNQIAFEGDAIPVELHVKSTDVDKEQSQIIIKEGTETLFSKNVEFRKQASFLSIPAELKPTKAGIHHYTIELKKISGELIYSNNKKDFVIEVLKSKQRILIAYNAPHPDIGAIKRSLETNANYSIETKQVNEITSPITDYNLVILYQIPSKIQAATTLLQSIIENNIPALYISGTQSDLQKLNSIFPGLFTQTRATGFDEAQANFNTTFPLFELDEEVKTFIQQCPPLTTPFAEYNTANSSVLAFQKVNNIETAKPLVLFFNNNETKTALINGEGLWRWRLEAYKRTNDFKLFDAGITKIAGYLALNYKKTKFIITANRLYQENEAVTIDAELYNDNYELINSPEITIDIKSKKGKQYSFAFSKTAKSYTLNAGIFPNGDYTYTAAVTQAGKTITQTGAFTVLPINVESEDIVAKHSEMAALAASHGGKMYVPNQLEKLTQELLSNENIKPISHFDKAMKELIDSPLLFFVILLLLSIEWFCRKYFGGY